ncbi:uncharacterized protein LODBEIA_P48650 [Lodderomyces beijingensis]|uniref:Mitochondrial import inner membrane translocase subunit TIM50 n=1 Tax=Lodderomyces beijingensis TaxID=1775926 RepID=A0ABP0ZU37_9ASCO
MNSIKILVNSFDNILPGNSVPSTKEDDFEQQQQQQQQKQQQKVNDEIESVDDDDESRVIKGPCKLLSSGPGEESEREAVLQDAAGSKEEQDDDYDDQIAEEVNLTEQEDNAEAQPGSNTGKSSPPAFAVGSILYAVWQVIFFLPNYLIIKPTRLVITVITYPFAMIKTSLGFGKKPIDELTYFDDKESELEMEEDPVVTRERSASIKSEQSLQTQEQDEYNDDAKVQQLKQDSILANEVKSPTFFSRYIIPPPIRLYPLSRNPQKKRKKKILILDLDETLIHSLSQGSPRSFHPASHSKMIEIKINNISSLYHVHKRPYCDYFLTEISKWFELQIFTASVKEYADPIINWLEEEIVNTMEKKNPERRHHHHHHQQQHHIFSDEPRPKIFTKRYYRNNCTYRQGVGYIKDLSAFIREDELKNVMILDNSPISYALHEDNAISIEGWINDQNDRDLLNLLPLLHSLSLCIDVRFILGLKNGEKLFES